MNSTPQFRILVVDDDPKMCDLLTTKLNLSGFTSQSCTSGEHALKVLAKEKFDAIISDLNMPGISGLELLAVTRRIVPHTAFLMATCVSDVSGGVSAMKQGAADYLIKPFQMEAVVVRLRRALEMKRMEAELAEYRQHLENMVEQRTEQLKAAMRRIELTYDETLEALAGALDLHDNETARHSRRVTLCSLEMGKWLNFTADQLKQLQRGSYLHDMGKIEIPNSILLKPGKLTPEETTIMQSHVRIGYDLMSRVAFLSFAAQIVLTHHESYDGTGYPQGLAGEQIPLGARIVAVANAFDTMCSKTPYKGECSFSEAVAELRRCSGAQFDPKVVDVFLSIPEETWKKLRADFALYVGPKGSAGSESEAFNHHLGVSQNATLKGERKVPSLLDTVTALANAIDAKDHYPQGHPQNVSRIAAQIASQMGLPDSAIEEIRLGGMLHDIGKIGVPEAVLNKPSALTPDEYELMKSRPLRGDKILEPLKVMGIERIRGIVRNHHERVDGTGYPDGLKGENIPLGARIIAVAESFDAIISDRCYQRGRSAEYAVAELHRCAGTHFDPAIVEAFLESLRALGDPPTRPS